MKIDFHPTVGVAGAHDVVSRQVVVLAGKKTIDLARRDVQRAKQNGHRRGEVLAMPRASDEEKMCQRIRTGLSAEVQRVAVAAPQETLDGCRFVVRSFRSHGYLQGPIRNARVE